MLSEHGGDLAASKATWGEPNVEIIDYSVNLNLFAPKIPKQTWLNWLDGVSSYPPQNTSGIELRLSEIYNTYSEDIVVTNGAMQALELSLNIFQGKNIYIPCPCFNEYMTLANRTGSQISEIEQTADTWQDLEFVKVIPKDSVIVLGNPGNPTGKRIPLNILIDTILSYPQISWIIDEAFIEFTDSPKENSLLNEIPENCIVVRSLTKLWSIPGIRLGFLASSNNDWIEQIRRQIPTWNLGWVAHAWSEHFLTQKSYNKLLDDMKAYSALRDDFCIKLNQIRGISVFPSEANYLLLKTDTSALEIAERLWKQGFAVRTMQGIPEIEINSYLRICVHNQKTNNAFIQALVKTLNYS